MSHFIPPVIATSVADPDPFDTYLDPTFHFDMYLDPTFHFDTDLDPAFQYDTDPDCFKEEMYQKP
jgi:hypothetical protein